MIAIPHWTGFLNPLATFAVLAMTSHSPAEAAPASHETLDELLSPLLERAYGFALRLLRNRADAEDLVQEAALAASRGFGTFQPGTNFKAWFFRILINCYYTRYRRQRHEGSPADLDETPQLYLHIRTAELGLYRDTADPAAALLSRLDAEQIAEALHALPEEYRVVSTLYFIEDLSYATIADIVGIPVGTVRSRLHRGRRILQKLLWRVAVESGVVSDRAESPA
jgi:RNA polymerase sigma-70 factor (ECF subfamily)